MLNQRQVGQLQLPFPIPLLGIKGYLKPGFYTVTCEAWERSHVTLRVEWQDEWRAHVISFLKGPNNWEDYQSFATYNNESGVLRIWRNFKKDGFRDQREAADFLCNNAWASGLDSMRKSYTLLSSRCSRCGRMLTRPDSIKRGMGEVCWEHST